MEEEYVDDEVDFCEWALGAAEFKPRPWIRGAAIKLSLRSSTSLGAVTGLKSV
jgi:hypothetical protein